MDAITRYISAHPSMLIIIGIFIIILILYFIFKKFIKFALVLLFIIFAMAGYYYFKDPDKMPEKIKKSVDIIKSGVDEVVEKSKSFYKDTKNLYQKSKEIPGDVNKLLKDSKEKAGN